MKNFKEIAEKCLSGELSGTFIIRNHKPLHSKYLYIYKIGRDTVYGYYELGGIVFDEKGENIPHKDRIQNFIPDNMQEQIKIDIPEGKVPAMEQTENGVVITWKEKELTYDDIESKLNCHIPGCGFLPNNTSIPFYKKVEVIRKLTNIRNYFGGDKPTNSWIITIDSALRPFVIKNPKPYRETCFIYFDTQEHAEQAIKMLGDELKYLFEPW